jgi:hypothetical protein
MHGLVPKLSPARYNAAMRTILVRWRWPLAGSCVAAMAACASDETSDTFGPYPPPKSDSGADVITDGFSDGNADRSSEGSVLVDAETCPTGASCGDGGVCAGGQCCAPDRACGSECCPTAQLCSFQKCVTPGKECGDSTDCAQTEYCEYSLGEPPDAAIAEGGSCVGGAGIRTGKCLPRPPSCAADAGVPPGGPITCLETCEYKPSAIDFKAVVQYSWGGQTSYPYSTDIMTTPIVIQLDDDNCDGKINANDIPDIVFSTFSGGGYTGPGTLHAISILNKQIVEKWTVANGVWGMTELAGGNIDGVAGSEIIACVSESGGVRAFKGDGQPLWSSTDALSCRIPLIADLDGDGQPEVVVEGGIVDARTGKTLHSFDPPQNVIASDIDGDGQLDVVTASQAYHADGSLFVDTGMKGNWPAVGDFDRDGVPEIVAVDYSTHRMWLWHFDASAAGKYTVVRQPLDINGSLNPALCPSGSAGSTMGGGPPTVADFNGDGVPDVALAGGVGYAVFDGTKLMDSKVPALQIPLWTKQTEDCSSAATGSSIFDFNGDGRAEVVYSDEQKFRIYEGATGNVLFETCNTTGTLIEYPVVADVDNDGHANILVVSNSYAVTCKSDNSKQAGLRIFSSESGTWVRTRRVWNEHSYHITNVEEDGTIPAHETPNWKQSGLNNFRQNKQPGYEFAAPDAVVQLVAACGGSPLVATVRNLGESALPAGLTVTFYAGSPPTAVPLGQATTTAILYSAQAEQVSIHPTNPPQDFVLGKLPAYATVTTPAGVQECRTDNNSSGQAYATCTGPK